MMMAMDSGLSNLLELLVLTKMTAIGLVMKSLILETIH